LLLKLFYTNEVTRDIGVWRIAVHLEQIVNDIVCF